MLDLSIVALQQSAAPAVDMFRTMFPLVLIFLIFYFLVIAPARKRQKKLQAMIDGLERGDRVVTTGGIYGEVVSTEGGVVFLKVADNVRLKLAKSAIAGMAEKDTEEKS